MLFYFQEQLQCQVFFHLAVAQEQGREAYSRDFECKIVHLYMRQDQEAFVYRF